MLSRVVIKNFKSIGEPGVDLELKPLTLLVGPNGSGKSSILEAIAVASQNEPSGRLTSFPSWGSILHKSDNTTATIKLYFNAANYGISPSFRVNFHPTGSLDFSYLTQDQDINLLTERKLRPELQSNTFLISSTRGDVRYEVNTSANPDWVGVRGQNLLLLLAIIFGQRRYRNTASKIARWANQFGISDLNAGFLGNDRASSDYLDDKIKVVLNLALASSGSRQILTVITQLFWAPEGSLLMIEEPEISLHPQGQIDVLEMFAEAIREDNKQIIATTHSIFMLQALGYAVLKGWLTPEQMAVYHVEKSEGGTTATLLPLDEKGYIRDWVPSFTEVERRLLLEWAQTLPRE